MLTFKEIIGYFSPARSPYYLIIVASIFGLMMTGDIDSDNQTWALIVILCGIPIILCFTLALFHKRKEEKDDDYNKEMKFARSAGIIGAVLATSTFFSDYIGNKQLLYFVFVLSICQILLFGTYLAVVQIQKVEREVTTNMLQLCLITTSLFVGICFCTSYEIKIQKTYQDVTQYKAIDAQYKAIDNTRDSILKARRPHSSGDIFDTDTVWDKLRAPLDEKQSALKAIPLYQKDIPHTEHYDDKYLDKFTFRYSVLRYGLAALWLILIFRWIFHLSALRKVPVSVEPAGDE